MKLHIILKTFLITLMTISSTVNASAQVVINEILPDGIVELKNLGSSTVNVGSYWLCDFPAYQQISNSNIICGNMMLGPGEILAVDDFNTINNSDGEMGLYTSSSFGNASAIIDYVEWGSTGHQRSSVAVAAGIWTTGDFVPAFAMGESLEYSGTGDSSSDWTATGSTTICGENGGGTPPCDVFVNDISLPDGSTSTSICVDGNPDPLEVVTNGGTPNVSTGWIITDLSGEILGLPQAPPFDLDGAGVGTCQIWYIRYEMGSGFGGNVLGNNLTDLTGCFALSNPIDVIREAPDGGMVSLVGGGTSYANCAGNIVFEVEHTTSSPNLSYWYIITDADDNILAWQNSTMGGTLDLSNAPAGECHVWGWNYRGLPDPIVGENISTLADDDCEDISDNWVTIFREIPDGGMVSLTNGNTTYTGTAGNIVIDVQHTTTAPNLSYWYIITDADDNILTWQNSANGNTLDLSGAPVGECHIWGWNYKGLADPIIGENISTLADDFCEDISDNWITVIREAGTPVASDFKAILSGTQQNPSALTPAYGNVQANLDGNILTISGSFSGLLGDFDANIAGGAHVHLGVAGRNGGVELLLTTDLSNDLRSGTFTAMNNTFTLTNEQLAALNARALYINIHTTAFPGGELRGQLLPNADEYLQAVLLGSNEIPSINTDAYGGLVFELKDNVLTVSGSFDDLSDEVAVALAGGAHIHDAPNGRNGGIVYPLNITLDADNRGAIVEANNNIFTLTDEQVDDLISNGYYINVHSLNFLPGELRGQITPFSSSIFRAQLTGGQEVPAINTAADGRLLLTYDGVGSIAVSGTFNNLSNAINLGLAGGAHIHLGAAGRTGGIEFLLNADLSLDSKNAVFHPEENTFNITPEQVDALFSRKLYVNVHSYNHPPGELRGQLLPLAKNYLGTNLSGLNQNPGIVSPAKGNLQFEITDNQLVVTGGFSDLTGDFAVDIAGGSHVHFGDATENGGIAILLNAMTDTDLRGGVYYPVENTFTISDGLKDSLLNGYLYVNIHTQAVLSGELRGQILRDDNAFPDGEFEIFSPGNNTQLAIDENVNTPIEILWEDTFDPNENVVVYTWQLSTKPDFSQLLVSEKTGTTLSFETSTNAILDALANVGITLGTDLELYHRVLASDGSVATSSEVFTLQVTKDGFACAAPDVINGFTLLGSFGDSKYYISNDVSRPVDAQLIAEGFGGYLTTISSQAENDFIQQNISSIAYIGLNDFDVEGNLEWFNGEPLTFNNIDPCSFCEVNADHQDFVIIAPWDGAWSFSNFFSQRRFIMEIPCDDSADFSPSNAQNMLAIAASENSPAVTMDKLMPNPAVDYIDAVLISSIDKEIELQIFDSRGSLVVAQTASLAPGSNTIQININNLPDGFYYVRFPQENGSNSAHRFVKVTD